MCAAIKVEPEPPNNSSTTHVAIDAHIIGGIGEDHLGDIAVHQRLHRPHVERVAADKPVRPETIDVARPATPQCRRAIGQDFFCGIARLLRRQALDQAVDLGDREAGDVERKAEIGLVELLELEGQKLLVPARVQRELDRHPPKPRSRRFR